MSFLSRLFGKKPQPKVVENKTAHLEALSLDALVNVIQSGNDEQVRIAAIQKISDLSTLIQLSGLSTSTATITTSLQKAAKQRLAHLCDAGTFAATDIAAVVTDKMALFSILGLLKDQALFEQTFNAITDETELAKIAGEGPTSKLRQRAAEKITDRELLQQLVKDTKTKDKSVFKIVKEKYDVFKEEEKHQAEVAAAVQTALHALEQQSHRPFDGQFTARVAYLTQQWDAKKADATPADLTRAAQAIAKCQETIDSISAEQAAQEAQRKAVDSAETERNDLLEKPHQLLIRLVNGETSVETAKVELDQLLVQWQSLSDIKKPNPVVQKNWDKSVRAIYNESNVQMAHGHLTQHTHYFDSLDKSSEEFAVIYQSLKSRVAQLSDLFIDAIPVAITQAQSTIAQWEKATADKTAEIQNTQRHILGLIRKANEHVSAGVIGKAVGIRRALDEKLQGLEQLPNFVANQLEQLDETLAKLQDWKSYAVLPKKHELIARLEALSDSKEHPETLATKIKRIQDEWRELSKGGKDQDQDLWEKFHDLAQKVYQPCRDYFAEQAAIRQQNLQSCKQLVAQLNDYLAQYHWDTPNWKDVEKVIRVARQEWRSFTPTERAATQPVLADFETALNQIQQKLHDEFARNADLKKQLIAEAQQLVNHDDSRKAADDIKKLQSRWQTIGASLRKEEQQLWREFRDACDAVFAKRQQQSVEFKAELDANLTTAKQWVDEIVQLTDLTGQALTDARKRVDEIRQAFGGLGQFPKAQVNEIKTAFTTAMDNFEKKIKDERVALKQQVWVNLFEANNELRLRELDLIAGKSVDIDSLRAKLEEITQWPSGGLKAIQQKLATLNASADVNENLLALRELCIRAEILTDTSTPAADQSLRTAFQVNQLQQNFGRKPQDLAAEFEQLVFEWIGVGAVATADYDALFARFNQCRLKVAN